MGFYGQEKNLKPLIYFLILYYLAALSKSRDYSYRNSDKGKKLRQLIECKNNRFFLGNLIDYLISVYIGSLPSPVKLNEFSIK